MWELYLECKLFQLLPSVRLQLEPRFSAQTAFDFDRAVVILGQTIEAALRVTDKQVADAPKSPGKDKVWKEVPRYTIQDLLQDPVGADDLAETEGALPDEFRDLPAAIL